MRALSPQTNEKTRQTMNTTNITYIEKRFCEINQITYPLDVFPMIEHHLPLRDKSKSHFGEIFTPINLVDKMILIAEPKPTHFNLDLCAGKGQFTVRMLRYFSINYDNFKIDQYLYDNHWFNEIQETSCLDLLYIFGNSINLAVGTSLELKNYPQEDNIWKRGIYKFDKTWHKSDHTLKNLHHLI